MFGFGIKNDALESLLTTLRMDMANNYKDAAQNDFRRLKDCYASLQAAGKLKAKQVQHYSDLFSELEHELKGYTHKDQNAKWDPKL